MNSTPLRVGDVIEITTERLAYGGDAIARHEGLAIFVPFAAPNERLRVRITERKKNFARAVIDSILEPSNSRREPPCQYFGSCGGCQLQHLTYPAQLEAKVGFVRDALERIGGLKWNGQIQIRHADEFRYRGRAQIKIDHLNGRVGFNRAATVEVCDIKNCPILVPELDEALQTVRLNAGDLHKKRDQSSPRSQIEIAAGESGVAVEPALQEFANSPLQRTVLGSVYRFGAATFFQANPGLLEELIEAAVGIESGNLAIDLYAGVGLFSIQLARRFNRVIGVEADKTSAEFGRENVTANGLTNIEFHQSAVDSWLKRANKTSRTRTDLMVLDPPRGGASEALSGIIESEPSRITYVSCDPTTLARDLRVLNGSGYDIAEVTAVDLFPQTYHIETIVKLARAG
ncbi:MAG TPA: class I SAM-dependent RNA methyltransferase [Blastocatellia bacterium]|nr:class I SAM-dependent RNA methyltransferase [Blastocatellia bacterium]